MTFIYVEWAFPFMVLGYFLTVALIGAVVVAQAGRRRGSTLPEDSAVEDVPAELQRPDQFSRGAAGRRGAATGDSPLERVDAG